MIIKKISDLPPISTALTPEAILPLVVAGDNYRVSALALLRQGAGYTAHCYSGTLLPATMLYTSADMLTHEVLDVYPDNRWIDGAQSGLNKLALKAHSDMVNQEIYAPHNSIHLKGGTRYVQYAVIETDSSIDSGLFAFHSPGKGENTAPAVCDKIAFNRYILWGEGSSRQEGNHRSFDLKGLTLRGGTYRHLLAIGMEQVVVSNRPWHQCEVVRIKSTTLDGNNAVSIDLPNPITIIERRQLPAGV